MKLLTSLLIFKTILNFGHSYPNLWDKIDGIHEGHLNALNTDKSVSHVAPENQLIRNRRAKIKLHLDKDNKNDAEFLVELANVLKEYQETKLKKEHIALRSLLNQVDDSEKRAALANLAKLITTNDVPDSAKIELDLNGPPAPQYTPVSPPPPVLLLSELINAGAVKRPPQDPRASDDSLKRMLDLNNLLISKQLV